MGLGKQKVSRSIIKDRYSSIFSCGYCAMCNIISVCQFEEVGYTCGYLDRNYNVIKIKA